MTQSGRQYRIVLVTCASKGEARKIARNVVGKGLTACANVLRGGVESIYRWKGKVERAREVLIMMKTSEPRLKELEREVKRLHSYEVPEFIVLPIAAGSREYLAWIGESVNPIRGAGVKRKAGLGRGRR
jgi:periplasmic divalent cation tolerance protein